MPSFRPLAHRTTVAPAPWRAGAVGAVALAVAVLGWWAADEVDAGMVALAVATTLVLSAVSRVAIDSPAGRTVATQPIVVAALLTLPPEVVPSSVAAALALSWLVGGSSRGPGQAHGGHRLLELLGQLVPTWGCIASAAVLARADVRPADTRPVTLGDWPVYLVALGAGLAAAALAAVLAHADRSGPTAVLRRQAWGWSVDSMLTPIGLTAAIASDHGWSAIVWACAPAGLLALLALDRSEHVESATRLSDAFEAAMRAARHDPLTDLANRRAWSEAVARADIEFAANPRDCTVDVLVADLDGLKMVNDLLGHDAGDDLICAAAEVLRAAVPAEAVIARLGGDEFGVLLVNSPISADEAAAAVRRSAALHPLVHNCSVELSIGWARCPPLTAVEVAVGAADRRAHLDKVERRSTPR